MDAAEHRQLDAAIEPSDEHRRKVQTKIYLAASNPLGRVAAGGQPHVADIGKALRTKQLLGDVLRSNADTRTIVKADRCCFEGALCGKRSLRADKTGGTRQRKRGHKPASGLYQRHRKPRIRWLHVVAMLSF